MDNLPAETNNSNSPIAGLEAINVSPSLANTSNPHDDKTVLFLFTSDLRLHDNPAIFEAIRNASHLIPVYCFDPREFAHFLTRPCGRHLTRFALDSVSDLRISLQSKGTDLIIRTGHPEEILPEICAAYNIHSAFMLKDPVYPAYVKYQRRLCNTLAFKNITMNSVSGNTMYEEKDLPFDESEFPDSSYAFLKTVRNVPIRNPLPVPRSIPPLPQHFSLPRGIIPTLSALGFNGTYVLPVQSFDIEYMTGGETEALRRLTLLVNQLSRFDESAEEQDLLFWSDIELWCTFGCISPRRIFRELRSIRSLDDVKKLTTFRNLVRKWEFMIVRFACKERLRGMKSSRQRILSHGGPYRAFQRS